MVSQKFPASQPKAGQPTGFVDAIRTGKKIHTIRANYPLWAKRVAEIQSGKAMLSVRVWSSAPYKSKQVECFTLSAADGVGIQKLQDPKNFDFASIEGKKIDWQTVAQNDGLTFNDFCDWFKGVRQDMAIIHFTKFRYG